MFFDFNTYASGKVKYGPFPTSCPSSATIDQRIGLSFKHMANIPERVIGSIIQIVKMIFFSLLVVFTLSLSSSIKNELRDSGRRFVLASAGIGISLIGFFAPFNAREWQGNLYMHMYKGREIDQITSSVLSL